MNLLYTQYSPLVLPKKDSRDACVECAAMKRQKIVAGIFMLSRIGGYDNNVSINSRLTDLSCLTMFFKFFIL